MKFVAPATLLAATAMFLTTTVMASAQDADATPENNGPPAPYHIQHEWLQLPMGRKWGAASAVDIDRDGKSVWVFERCGNTDDGCALHKDVNPILKFDSNGVLVKSFGAGMFKDPHGIYVDKDDNIWVVDGLSNSGMIGDTIRKFTPDGKLLLTMGTDGVAGYGPYVYNGLSDVVLAPNGDIFVADGHGSATNNNRVIKYDSNGKYIKEFAPRGSAPEDTNPPHGLAMDKEGRLYVADRNNHAVKIFDQDGKLLNVWKQFGSPSGVFVDKNDILYVSDFNSTVKTNPGSGITTPGIRWGSVSDGKVTGYIPYMEFASLEGVAVDDDGIIYGGLTNIPGSVRWVKNPPAAPRPAAPAVAPAP